MAEEKLVETSERRETQLHRGATQVLPPQKPHETAEIIALKLFPRGRRLAFVQVPAREFRQCLAVIALRVNRRAAVGAKMSQETFDP